jgi:hypothetical protein
MNRNKFSLLVACVTILITSVPASAQQGPSGGLSGDVNLFGVGVSLLNNLLYPPHRAAEIAAEAEIKKAKIAAEAEIQKSRMQIEASASADKVSPLLDRWGVSRVNCTTPGLAFINIDTSTVCVQPNGKISAGYYTYNSEKNQLLKTSNGNSQPTPSNSAPSNSTPSNSVPASATASGTSSRKGF